VSFDGLGPFDDGQLHLILFGPGRGETALVRMPSAMWLVVDSLLSTRVRDFNPAVELLRREGAVLDAFVLTHPHGDHAEGVPELLSLARPGAPIGCFPRFFDNPASWRASPDAERVLAGATANTALNAVHAAWDREPPSRWELVAGATRTFGECVVEPLMPPVADLSLAEPRAELNAYSTPLRIAWGETSILLGADLTYRRWEEIARGKRKDLPSGAALKVSHHGSKRSQHPIATGEPPARDRPCLIAPYNRGRGLPRSTQTKVCNSSSRLTVESRSPRCAQPLNQAKTGR
jgi:hypothetical protein